MPRSLARVRNATPSPRITPRPPLSAISVITLATGIDSIVLRQTHRGSSRRCPSAPCSLLHSALPGHRCLQPVSVPI
jgi:hypothetical protein